MTKRLTALGFAAVAVVWGPYVYAELARKPLPAETAESPTPVIEPTPVSYHTPPPDRSQLLAALAEREKAAAARAPAHTDETEPAAPPPAEHNSAAAASEVPAEPPLAQEPPPVPAQPLAAPRAEHDPAQLTAAAAQGFAKGPADDAHEPSDDTHSEMQAPAKDEPSADAKHEAEAKHEADAKQEAEAKHEADAKQEAEAKHEADAKREAEAKHDDVEAKHEAEAKHEGDSPTPESLAPAFRSAFDRESRDTAWANGEEPRLTQLLEGAGVPASAISEVRCQSTVCRIALNSVDLKTVQQSPLYQLISSRVKDEFGTLGLDASGEGEQHAAFYILRKGYELDRARDTN